MLDGYHCSHAVSDICPGKIRIFFLQDPQLSRIGIDNRSKCRLKSGQMSASLCIVYIIAKTQHVLMELCRILKCGFYGNPFIFSVKIYHVADGIKIPVQILYKADDSFFLMVLYMLRFFSPSILVDNRQIRIQIGGLVHSALDILRLKSGLFKYFRIWQKINLCPCRFRLTQLRKKSLLQIYHWNPSLIPVMMDIALPADFHIHIS